MHDVTQASLALTCKKLVPFLLDGSVLLWHDAEDAHKVPGLNSLSSSLAKYPNTATSVSVMALDFMELAGRHLPACSLPYG